MAIIDLTFTDKETNNTKTRKVAYIEQAVRIVNDWVSNDCAKTESSTITVEYSDNLMKPIMTEELTYRHQEFIGVAHYPFGVRWFVGR